jgi:hydrogenase nickel incorporation protein HypB
MCDTCGCGQEGPVRIGIPGKAPSNPRLRGTHEALPGIHEHEHEHDGHVHSHPHSHEHGDGHDHPHDGDTRKEILLNRNILGKNDLLAERNRGFFEAREILAINLVSSPGSGKTTLLERTIHGMKETHNFFVIEGDQQTMFDAERIQKTGAPVIQINTGNGCHLDAGMVHDAVKKLDVPSGSILMIENVGNLVCPSLFDLGEAKRVVIISVTEGEDKPAKYPTMFQTSHVCIINKTDLLPYVDFDVKKARDYALRINPSIEFIELSTKTGEGMPLWINWLKKVKAER